MLSKKNLSGKDKMSAFGILLKSYRQNKNLTQKQLAERCEPSFVEHYIFLLESGRKIAPPEETVLNLAKALLLSKKETKVLVEAARNDRLSLAFMKNCKVKAESVAECLAKNFSREELIIITNQLQV